MSVKNASQHPKVYYGLHMCEGVAEYKDQGKDPYRIFIGERAIKNMDPTFQGKPVYVRHVDEVNLDKLHEADGYVVESFFNQADGKHWCKFIIVSDKGHEAVRNGWKLSNAYIPKSFSVGGLWHGVEYAKEVTQGEYEHLAIVNNPRYEESVILTPEQFKEYNGEKQLELKRLANSKGEKKVSLFKFFKKEKLENSADMESMSVLLPESKKEVTVAEAISIADKFINMHGYANPEHMVKVNDEEMSVGQLVDSYSGMMKKNAEEKAKAEEEKKKNAEGEKKEEKKEEEKKENEEKPEEKKEEEKKENEEELAKKEVKPEVHGDEAMKKNAKENFDALKDAEKKALQNSPTIELSEDKVARGKSRYGSN